MTTKWYEWIGDKQVEWDLRERIDQFKDDTSIVYYLADLTLNELREFRDYIIWNELFFDRILLRTDVADIMKEWKQEFEECKQIFTIEESRYPIDTGDY